MPDRRTVTVPEAAEILGISRSGAYDLISRGALPGLRLGRRIVVPIDQLDRLLDDGSNRLGRPMEPRTTE